VIFRARFGGAARDTDPAARKMHMTLKVLVDEIAADFSSPAEADRAARSVLKGIENVVRRGGEVDMRGFGKFHQKNSGERIGRNPKTGESANIPARSRLGFKSRVIY